MSVDYSKLFVDGWPDLTKPSIKRNPKRYFDFIRRGWGSSNGVDLVDDKLRLYLDITTRDIIFHEPKRITKMREEGFTYKGYEYFHFKLDDDFKLNITPLKKVRGGVSIFEGPETESCPLCLGDIIAGKEVFKSFCCNKPFCVRCFDDAPKATFDKCPCCREPGKKPTDVFEKFE